MKLNKLALALAVASLVACGDKGDETGSADDNTSGKLATTVKESTQTVTESIDKTVDAGQKIVTETADAAKETSQEISASADEASKKLADTADQTQAVIDENAAAVTALADESVSTLNKTETAVMETTATSAAALDPQKITEGKRVYSGNCMSCHAPGIAGAPKLGEASIWQARIAQGMDTLYQHALEGFKGSTGYMPPKGGFTSLSDAEVKAAVDYMVSASQ